MAEHHQKIPPLLLWELSAPSCTERIQLAEVEPGLGCSLDFQISTQNLPLPAKPNTEEQLAFILEHN